MSSLSIFLSIIAALSIGAMSPGPSFVLVSRIAMSRSRLDGLAASLGMGVGGVAFSVLALAGLTTLLSHFGWLYLGLKVAGGTYLVFIAFRIWRGAREPLHVGDAGSDRRALGRSFATALLTQISTQRRSLSMQASLLRCCRKPSRLVSSLQCRLASLRLKPAGTRLWRSHFRPHIRDDFTSLPRHRSTVWPGQSWLASACNSSPPGWPAAEVSWCCWGRYRRYPWPQAFARNSVAIASSADRRHWHRPAAAKALRAQSSPPQGTGPEGQ